MQSEINYQKNNRINLLEEFQAAPLEAWFGQEIVAVIRDCSEATVERDRWFGGGVPFVKCGRSVRYSKSSILEWLAKHKPVQSTTESDAREGK